MCQAGYYLHLMLHFNEYGTDLIMVSDQEPQLKRYSLYLSK